MSKTNKILNYIAMVCAIIATILFFINQDWNAFTWAIVALLWMIYSHLTENCYYSQKESLDKLTDDYINTLTIHRKEVKELKDEIESLKK